MYSAFVNRRESHVASFFRILVNMRSQLCVRPGFSRVSKILRLLTGNVDDPCFLIICDLSITTAARSIKQSVLYTALRIFLKTKHNAFTIDTDLIGYIIDRTAISFQ